MADRYRSREPRDRDYRDGYSSRSHTSGHSTFSYGHRRSPSPGLSHHSRRQSPPQPPRMAAPPASSIHTMIAHSCTSISLDERFTALKRTRSASPSPPPRDSLSSGSAKNRQYLDQLAHRTDVLDKIEGDSRRQRSRDRDRSPVAPRQQRASNGNPHSESHNSSRSDRLEATKRIAASRSRGNVHSRLGINRTVGGGGAAMATARPGNRPIPRDGGAAATGAVNYSQFVKHPRPQQQQQHQQPAQHQQDHSGQKRNAGKSVDDLDDELDAYMKQRA
eukprot:scpid39837/ scgid30411/ 